MTAPEPDEPTEPTQPAEPPPPPPPPPPTPRRLTRSRSDRVLAGVGGGLAELFGIDPILVRLGIGLLVIITGGAAILLYLAAWLLVPEAPATPGAAPVQWSRAASIGGVVALIALVCIALPGGILIGWIVWPLAIIALAGLAVWWLILGIPPERTGRGVLLGIVLGLTVLVVAGLLFFAGAAGVAGGGGIAVAAIVLGAGLTLVAGAFVRPLRWLILPALALGLGAGTAVAAGVEDVGGATGERFYRPAAPAEISRHYELGAGHLVVDLRGADLSGEHRVDVDLGAGLAEVLVPEGTCVATNLHAGIGGMEVFGAGTGGVDTDRVETGRAPAGTPRVVVTGDVGIGLIYIDNVPENDHDWERNWHERDSGSADRGGNACIGDRGAQG